MNFKLKDIVWWRWKNNVADFVQGTFYEYSADGKQIMLGYPDRTCRWFFKLSDIEIKKSH